MTASHDVKPELIELFPFGVSVMDASSRPILILKDKSQTEVLPVWLNPVDAGLAVVGLTQSIASSHGISKRIMENMGVKLERVEFTEIIGHHQYIHVYFKGLNNLEVMRARADEALSFCLSAQARFFSTKDYMMRCRNLDAQMNQLQIGLQKQPKISAKNHPYMM